MSETEKQFQNELNSLDVKMQKEVYDEAMDNAFLGSIQKIEHPEIAVLKQRISDLEQQLKTAREDGVREFCAGLRIIIPERSANISIAMKRYISSVEN